MRLSLVAALLVAVLNAVLWQTTERSVVAHEVSEPINYVSYSPYRLGPGPQETDLIPPEQIRDDLNAIAGVARGARIYSTIHGMDEAPGIAQKLGLNMIIGAWIGDTEARDRREIDDVVRLAKQYRNVRSVLVGNEVLLRGERTVDEMMQLIRDTKQRVRVPVSTGEIWYTWLQYPQLAKAVDYLAVHILPYWEGVKPEDAVSYTMNKIDELRKTFPGKRIVVMEFGWPSQGYNYLDAVPGGLSQAEIIRDFIAEAEKRGIEYNIIEAFDQPWKTNEGSVGAYWGIFDADRQPKFPLTGVVEDQANDWKMGAAVALGFLLTMGALWRRRPTFGHALAVAVAANAMAFGIALALAYPFLNYMNGGIWVMWAMGTVLVSFLTVMTLAKVHEMADVLLGHRPRRLITRNALPFTDRAPPMVSIHVPAYREPAAMVNETLDSLAALDYPNYEVVVIVNNTPEAEYSAPVAARCRELGSRFKFLDITCTGFKAGALNVALEHTAPDAEIIAVIDADYVVHRDWLSDLTRFFDDPKVAIVQAPQDHRDGERSGLKAMMNSEYAGFFDIGMVQRNEDNAIIAHGTMLMVRRSALMEVGGWGTDTIVEDTELGLRLFEAGYEAHYTNFRYGHGMLPDTFKAFKTQRFRWAYGAIQIIRKHWAHMMPGARTLSPAQKAQYLTGWTFWLSDALGALASILNLLWVPMVLFVGVVIPMMSFTVPILAAFIVNVLHCALLYWKRVGIPPKKILGGAIAAMSLQLTVANAVFTGLVKDRLAFARTEKGGNTKRTTDNPVRWEMIFGVLLAVAAVVLWVTNTQHITEIAVYGATLMVQSVPFLAAVLMVWIERRDNRRRLASGAPASVAPASVRAASA